MSKTHMISHLNAILVKSDVFLNREHSIALESFPLAFYTLSRTSRNLCEEGTMRFYSSNSVSMAAALTGLSFFRKAAMSSSIFINFRYFSEVVPGVTLQI